MENKRNTIVLIIITIAIFLVAVLGATFAYFATERNVGATLNANVQTAASMYSFTATSTDKIEINIAFNEMSEAGVSTEKIASDNAAIEVSLASPNNDTLTACTYDIVWVWDGTDKYITPDKAIPFMDSDKIYNYEFSTTIDGKNETDLSKLILNGDKVLLQSGASISSTSTTTVTKKYDLRANIYNLPVDQTNLFGKSFKAHVMIENLNCKMTDISSETLAQLPTLATFIKEDVFAGSNPSGTAGLYYHTSDTTSANYLATGAIDDTYRYAGGFNYPKASEGYNSYDKIFVVENFNSILQELEYTLAYDVTKTKYIGADALAKAINDGYIEESVNNYVCFLGDNCADENNLYRIISVDSNTNQTKLIKATSLGKMKWHDRVNSYTAQTEDVDLTAGTIYENIWAIKQKDGTYYKSSLNEYLNGEYLDNLTIKSKIVDTTWHVGGYTYNQGYKSTPQVIYGIEKDDTRTYPAKIGLMYASEYGFAALPEYWTHVMGNNSTNGYNFSKGKDWMVTIADYYPWTVSHISDASIRALYISSQGWFLASEDADFLKATRPSFALSSDVKITNAEDGVGTKEKPMIIY